MNSSPAGRGWPAFGRSQTNIGFSETGQIPESPTDLNHDALQKLLEAGNPITLHVEPRQQALPGQGSESGSDEPRGFQKSRRSVLPAILAGEPPEAWPELNEPPERHEAIGSKVAALVQNCEAWRHRRYLKLEKEDLDFFQGNLLAWNALATFDIRGIELPRALTELPAGMRLLRNLKVICLPDYNGRLLDLLPYQMGHDDEEVKIRLSGSRPRLQIEVICSSRKSAVRIDYGEEYLQIVFSRKTNGPGEPVQFSTVPGSGGKLPVRLTDVDTQLQEVLEKGWPKEQEMPLPRQISNVEQRERATSLRLLIRSMHEPTALEMLNGLLLARKTMTASELLSLLYHPSAKNDSLHPNLHAIRSQRWDIFEHVLESFYMRQEFVDQLDDLEVCLLGNMWLGEPTATYTDRSAALRMVFGRYSGVMKLAGLVRNPVMQRKLLEILKADLCLARKQSETAMKLYQAHTKVYLKNLYRKYAPDELASVTSLIDALPEKPSDNHDAFTAQQKVYIGDLLKESWELLPYEKNIVGALKTRTLLLSLIPPHVFMARSDSIFKFVSKISGKTYESINLPRYMPYWPKGIERCRTKRIEAPYFRGLQIDLMEALQRRSPDQILTIDLGEPDAGREAEPDLLMPAETSVELIIDSKMKMKGDGRRTHASPANSPNALPSTLWNSGEPLRPAGRKVKRQKLSPERVADDVSDMVICAQPGVIEEKIMQRRQRVWNTVLTAGPRQQLLALEGFIRDDELTAAEKFEIFQNESGATESWWLLSTVVTPTLEKLLLNFLVSDAFLDGLDEGRLQRLSDNILSTDLTCADVANRRSTMREEFVNAALSKNFVLRLLPDAANRYLQIIGSRVGRVLRQRQIQRPQTLPHNWKLAHIGDIITRAPELKKGFANLLNQTCWFWRIRQSMQPDAREKNKTESIGNYFSFPKARGNDRAMRWAEVQLPELLNAARMDDEKPEAAGQWIIDLSIIEPELIPLISKKGWGRLVSRWKNGNTKQGLFSGIHLPPGLTELPVHMLQRLGVGLERVSVPGYRGITLDIKNRRTTKSRKKQIPRLTFFLGYTEGMPHVSFSGMVDGSCCRYRWRDLARGALAPVSGDAWGHFSVSDQFSGFGELTIEVTKTDPKLAVKENTKHKVSSPSSVSDEVSYELIEEGVAKASERLRSVPMDSRVDALVAATCELLQYHEEDPFAPMQWLKQQMRKSQLSFSAAGLQKVLRKLAKKKNWSALCGREVESFLRFIFSGLREITPVPGALSDCVQLTVDLILMIAREDDLHRGQDLFSPVPQRPQDRRAAVFRTVQKSGSVVMRDIKYLTFVARHAKEYVWCSWSCVGDRMPLPDTWWKIEDAQMDDGAPLEVTEPIFCDDILLLEHLDAKEAEYKIMSLLAFGENVLSSIRYVILPHGLTEIPPYIAQLIRCRVLVANRFHGTQVLASRMPKNAEGERAECIDFVCHRGARTRKRKELGFDVKCEYEHALQTGHHYVRILSEQGVRFDYPVCSSEENKWLQKWYELIGRCQKSETEQDIRADCEQLLKAEDLVRSRKIATLISGSLLKRSCESGCGYVIPTLLKELINSCFELEKVDSNGDLLLISMMFEMFRRFNWFQWCDRADFQADIDDSFMVIATFMEHLKKSAPPEVARHVRREQLFWLDEVRTSMTRQKVRPGYLRWYASMTGLPAGGNDQSMINSLVERFQEFRLDRMATGDTKTLMQYFQRQSIMPSSQFALDIARALSGDTLNFTGWSKEKLHSIDIDMLRAFEQQAGKKKITRLNLPAGLEAIPDCARLMKDLEYIRAPDFQGDGVDLRAWEFDSRQGSMLIFDICSDGPRPRQARRPAEMKFVSRRRIAVLIAYQDDGGHASYQIVFPCGDPDLGQRGFSRVDEIFSALRQNLSINERAIKLGAAGAGQWVEALYFLLEHIDSFKREKNQDWWKKVVRELVPLLVYTEYPKGVAYLVYKIVQGLYSSNRGRPGTDLQFTLVEQCAQSLFLGALLDSELAVLLPLLLASAQDNRGEPGWEALAESIELLEVKAQGCGLQIEGGGMDWRSFSERRASMDLVPPDEPQNPLPVVVLPPAAWPGRERPIPTVMHPMPMSVVAPVPYNLAPLGPEFSPMPTIESAMLRLSSTQQFAVWLANQRRFHGSGEPNEPSPPPGQL
jgi:hypothetical protein